MKTSHEQSYENRTADAETTIRDLVSVGRASSDQTIRQLQKSDASGVLHEWIETTDQIGDAPQCYNADRIRLIALINTALLDV